EMSEENWSHGSPKSLAVYLNGQAIPTLDPRGERVVDDTFFVLFSAHSGPLPFRLRGSPWDGVWEQVLDTAQPFPREGAERRGPGAEVPVAGRSVVVLRKVG